MVNGILKHDCVVRSPSNNNNIIPDEAIASTIEPLNRILLIIVCHKKSLSCSSMPKNKYFGTG